MSFKDFDLANDVNIQLSVVNEVMALTGSYFSGTDYYKKKYINITSGSYVSGGFWSTFYDGSPTSTSSSALIDFTYGHSTSSLMYGYSETFLQTEKNKIYEQMANYLLGDKSSIFTFNSIKYRECFFLNMKRRIFKDEIAKGNTVISLQMTGNTAGNALNLTDTGAASAYTVGSAGEEANVYSGSSVIGKVYYNAGIIVLATGAFVPAALNHSPHWSGSSRGELYNNCITGTIDNICDGLANHINNIQFHNQTNLHSTIYFCRALNNEFNYSSNPTFVDGDGRILPTSGSDNQTCAYPTGIGLYDVNNNLLGVAKLSEPVKKGPDSEIVVRCRLSY